MKSRRQRIIDDYHRQKRHKHTTTELLVDCNESAKQEIKQLGFKIGEPIEYTSYTIVYLPKGLSVDDAIAKLSGIIGVNDIEINMIHETAEAPNDPGFGNMIINSNIMDIEGMWDLFSNYRGLIYPNVIAVIDSGFITTHKELEGQLILPGYNSVDGTSNVTERSQTASTSHGTIVSGVMVAKMNNHNSISGLAFNSKVYPIRCSDDNGNITTANIAKGVAKAINLGIRLINISLLITFTSVFEQIAYKIRQKDIVLFIAAGNEIHNPGANFAGVYGISGLDADFLGTMPSGEDQWITSKQVNQGSAYFEGTSFCAPHMPVSIFPLFEDRYGIAPGTSFASPFALSLPAQMLAIDPTLSVYEIISFMAANCISETPPAGSQQYGYGIPQFTKTLDAVMKNTLKKTNLIFHGNELIKQLRYQGKLVDAIYRLDEYGQFKKVWNPIADYESDINGIGLLDVDGNRLFDIDGNRLFVRR